MILGVGLLNIGSEYVVWSSHGLFRGVNRLYTGCLQCSCRFGLWFKEMAQHVVASTSPCGVCTKPRRTTV